MSDNKIEAKSTAARLLGAWVLRELSHDERREVGIALLDLGYAPIRQLGEHEEMIGVESVYGVRGGDPLVRLSWGALEANLKPAEAKAHGVLVIESAAAAEFDARLMGLLGDMGWDGAECVDILRRLRERQAAEPGV